MDLLQCALGGQGRWTQAVSVEAARSARHLPAIEQLISESWLGDPIEIDDIQVHRIRIAQFGGTAAEPTRHLGEAETCYLLHHSGDPAYSDAVWITDDIAAYYYGKQLGIVTQSTTTLFEGLVRDGDLSPIDAFALLTRLADSNRGIIEMPSSPADLTR